jgi:L-rhamnose isomerase
MKINFTGHSTTEREVEINQEEMSLVFELMKQHFLTHVEFGTFESAYYSTPEEKLCQNHQVDVGYKKDRLAFFQAIMSNMENPYK